MRVAGPRRNASFSRRPGRCQSNSAMMDATFWYWYVYTCTYIPKYIHNYMQRWFAYVRSYKNTEIPLYIYVCVYVHKQIRIFAPPPLPPTLSLFLPLSLPRSLSFPPLPLPLPLPLSLPLSLSLSFSISTYVHQTWPNNVNTVW